MRLWLVLLYYFPVVANASALSFHAQSERLNLRIELPSDYKRNDCLIRIHSDRNLEISSLSQRSCQAPESYADTTPGPDVPELYFPVIDIALEPTHQYEVSFETKKADEIQYGINSLYNRNSYLTNNRQVTIIPIRHLFEWENFLNVFPGDTVVSSFC